MTLQDIYNQLSFGELRHLFLSGTEIDNPNATMPKESFLMLLPSVQLGLIELHKRFALREGTLTLELVTGKSEYLLQTAYAESSTNSQQPVKYIKDVSSPFRSDLFKVERIYGTYRGDECELVLNEINNVGAIRTSAFDTLQVPTDPLKALWLPESPTLRVVYRADHPQITDYLATASPLITPIYLPPTHLEALCFYIASRILNPIGMTPGAMHEGNNYFTRFMASVTELKNQNFEIDDDSEDTKFQSRGFV
jgi:hypothetical protein